MKLRPNERFVTYVAGTSCAHSMLLGVLSCVVADLAGFPWWYGALVWCACGLVIGQAVKHILAKFIRDGVMGPWL